LDYSVPAAPPAVAADILAAIPNAEPIPKVVAHKAIQPNPQIDAHATEQTPESITPPPFIIFRFSFAEL
jgi:hypothetical protein